MTTLGSLGAELAPGLFISATDSHEDELAAKYWTILFQLLLSAREQRLRPLLLPRLLLLE
jgi:hypothetical protein